MRRLLLFLLLVVSGCVLPRAETEPPPARSVPVTVTSIDAADVIASANQARARHDLSALVADAALNEAAADFARELARRRVLTHTSERVRFRTLMDRIDRAGAQDIVRAGENVAMMSARPGMPAQVAKMWLDSPGHRRNLLDPSFRLTGAGVARAADNTWYFVQVYAARATRSR